MTQYCSKHVENWKKCLNDVKKLKINKDMYVYLNASLLLIKHFD